MERFVKTIGQVPFHKVLYALAFAVFLWSAYGYYIFAGDGFRAMMGRIIPLPGLLPLWSVLGGLAGVALLVAVQWLELRPIITMHGYSLHDIDNYIARRHAGSEPQFDWRTVSVPEVEQQSTLAVAGYVIDLVVSLFVWPIVSYTYLAAGAVSFADFSMANLISAGLCVFGLQQLISWALKAELELGSKGNVGKSESKTKSAKSKGAAKRAA
jgi:hypothetical protein